MLEPQSRETDARQYSPLSLAYLGDVVYELLVREQMMLRANMPVQKLHHNTVSWVCAHAQSQAMEVLLPLLTEEELSVYKRGRNATSHVPKHAQVADYRRATGLEALFGYLYLKGDSPRIHLLFKTIWQAFDFDGFREASQKTV